MTHPLIEALLAPSRDFYETREQLAELYHQSDDQAVMEAAWELANWLPSTRAIRRMLEQHCQRADLDQAVSPHDLRHTFGSRVVEQGASLPVAQKLLGHVRLSSTQRYLHTSPAELSSAVSRI